MRIGRSVVLVATLAVAQACAPAGGRGVAPVAALPESSVSVEVTNEYLQTMEVFASGGGAVFRLGIVSPGEIGHFALRAALLTGGGDVQLWARPLGSRALVRSGSLRPQPGDTLDFEIPAALRGSVASIRP